MKSFSMSAIDVSGSDCSMCSSDTNSSAREIKFEYFDSSKCEKFEDFPICKKTLKGLTSSKFMKPTDIQREAIGLALNGNDILGAAKTGSGKTLAFIIPILEHLYSEKWSQNDGLGALIISPTRELAFQTFEVLKKIGKFHDFSAGLVIGGKPLKEEAGRINRTNIVVCTPGRLLQHMDETTYFNADSLQIVVLDEADRILDMGFSQTMNAIIENLPAERQTLLFSATQTRSVKDLARLSLTDPVFVSVHENATNSTPEQLEQSYMVCEQHEKLNLLWSFLKNHLQSKILVFLTCCKEVKYVYEAMRRLRPGIPVMALHGGLPQLRRVEAYNQFVNKQRACLFATDIAARGLDFPAVNWVVQLDCPEDANTYIHRAGRTARYEKDGQALLVLLPSEEEAMVKQLNDKKIPIEKIRVNRKRLYSIQAKMESNCAAEPELKEAAQRAFMTYLKSVYLMSNKKVSLGLAIAPKIRFLKKDQKRKEEQALKQTVVEQKLAKNAQKKPQSEESSSESDSGGEEGTCSESDSSGSEVNSSKEIEKKVENGDSDSSEESDLENEARTSNEKKLTKLKQKDKPEINLKSVKQTESVSKLQKVNKLSTKKSNKELADSDESSESDDSESGESSDNESDSDDSEKLKALKAGKTESFSFDVDEDDELFKVKKDVDIDEILGVLPEVDPNKGSNVDIETGDAGGINIALAKKRMEAEDDEEVQAVLGSSDGEDKADPLSFIPDPDEIYGARGSDESSAESYDDASPPVSKKRKIQDKLSGRKQNTAESSSDSGDESDDVINSDDDVSSSGGDVMDTELSLKDDEAIALKSRDGKTRIV
ncbi:DDX10-like protein [Mya arenaria]|uniref:ATP-dependent RNA helicase n=1 Tax=Mya arenaria TaxID=6604 RepID=A0ABY7EDF8_MYAAR|nr:DDX10-like protein [Mya arenaria]